MPACGTQDVVILQNGKVVDAIARSSNHPYDGPSSLSGKAPGFTDAAGVTRRRHLPGRPRAASHDHRRHHRALPAGGMRLSGRAPRHARGGARAQPQPVRVRADPRPARPRADAHRTRGLLRALVGALLLQALQADPQDVPDHGPAGPAGPGRERRRDRGSATAGPSPSRSSRTTTRRPSSRTRAPPPAWAASCATSSRWARGRSRCSTPCASARSTRPQPLPLRRRGQGRRRLRQLRRRADGRRRGRASPTATTAIRWSTRCASGLLREERADPRAGARRRQPAHGGRRAHRARRHPRRVLRVRGPLRGERGQPPAGAGRRSRSPRSCCSRPASS